MSLYRYFKTQGRELPNPSGPLSSSVSSAAIEEANAAVSATCTKEKRGPYQTLSDETRAKIGKYAGADPRGCMGCCSTPPDSSVQILLCINHC